MVLKYFTIYNGVTYIDKDSLMGNETLCIDDSLTNMAGRGHGGGVVSHLPATSEVSSSNSRLYVEKLVLAYQWWAVYNTEP